MAKLGLGDWGELICTAAGIVGGLGAVTVGAMTGTGFLMKKFDSTYETKKLTAQRNQIESELGVMIHQEVLRQRAIEKQYAQDQYGNLTL